MAPRDDEERNLFGEGPVDGIWPKLAKVEDELS